jgi:hypothetical protein
MISKRPASIFPDDGADPEQGCFQAFKVEVGCGFYQLIAVCPGLARLGYRRGNLLYDRPDVSFGGFGVLHCRSHRTAALMALDDE